MLFSSSIFACGRVAESRPSGYLTTMANGLMPLVGLCALYLSCTGCSSDHDPDGSSTAGAATAGGAGQAGAGTAGASTTAGTASRGGTPASGGAPVSGGSAPSAGSGGKPVAEDGSHPPPA